MNKNALAGTGLCSAESLRRFALYGPYALYRHYQAQCAAKPEPCYAFSLLILIDLFS